MAESITGCDGYIVAQALAHFIVFQDALPEDLRQQSNQRGAARLLLKGGEEELLAHLLGEAMLTLNLLQDDAVGLVESAEGRMKVADYDAKARERLEDLRAELGAPPLDQ